MNFRQLRARLRKYYFSLLSEGAVIVYDVDYDALLAGDADRGYSNQLDLAMSMTHNMIEWLDEPLFEDKVTKADVGKLNRWLGFIQCILWTTNIRSINEMREESRPIFKD